MYVFFFCSLATRFETTRKLNSLLKEDEPAALTKRVSVAPPKYGDDSDGSTDTKTQSLHVKAMLIYF